MSRILLQADTTLDTWFERDRAHVWLRQRNGDTIVEWWDEEVTEAVENGFLDPRDLHGSAYRHAVEMGIIARPGVAA
jgi:hypothetical protein